MGDPKDYLTGSHRKPLLIPPAVGPWLWALGHPGREQCVEGRLRHFSWLMLTSWHAGLELHLGSLGKRDPIQFAEGPNFDGNVFWA